MIDRLDDVFPGGSLSFPLRTVGERHSPTGELRLMLALLCDAIHVYAADHVRRRRPRQLHELHAWFESTDRSYVFAFDSVCDALGLEAGYIRRRVLGSRPPFVRRPWVHRVHASRIVAPRAPRKAAAG